MAREKTYREIYAPIIAQIIKDNEGKPIKELKKILCAANQGPYGHHRKTWANEYMRQLGLSKKKSKHKELQNQTTLF